jgi:hypothetical protein
MPEDRIDALTEAADAEFMYQYEATAAPRPRLLWASRPRVSVAALHCRCATLSPDTGARLWVSASLSSSPPSSSAKWGVLPRRRHLRPFAAWDGDEIVATANLFIRGEASADRARRRGYQRRLPLASRGNR